MGALGGHLASGIAFLVIGLWQLFNHIKLHLLHPNSYTSSVWFPISKFRYIEPFFILFFSSIFISTEMFIGHSRYIPLEPDGSISPTRLHNLEHTAITITFVVYAAFAIILDKIAARAQYSLTQFLASLAFVQQLLLFHFHSTDHVGIEGQYHFLLQTLIFTSLITTLMGIGMPKSFIVSFIRSLSIFSQGAWLIILGYMLWTPELVPKGCFLHKEEGDMKVVRCSNHQALHRAKALVNLQFSWFLVAIAILGIAFYVVLGKFYGKSVEYLTLKSEEVEEDSYDVELKEKTKVEVGDSMIFVHHGVCSK